jgi:flagellar basal body-associated protein FliL
MRKFRKKVRIVWIVISALAVISMIGFLLAPAFVGY